MTAWVFGVPSLVMHPLSSAQSTESGIKFRLYEYHHLLSNSCRSPYASAYHGAPNPPFTRDTGENEASKAPPLILMNGCGRLRCVGEQKPIDAHSIPFPRVGVCEVLGVQTKYPPC